MKVRELAPHPHNYMLLFMVCCSLAMPTYLLYSQQILTTQKFLYPCTEEDWGGRCLLDGSSPIIWRLVYVLEYTEETQNKY